MNSEKKSKRQRRRPSPHEEREEFVSRGDLLGFMEILQQQGPDMIGMASSQLRRCIKNRAKDDLDGLTDDSFALMLELAVNMLARSHYLVISATEQHDDRGAAFQSLPHGIDPLLDRSERISKFIVQLASDRARIRHLGRLAASHGDANRKGSHGRYVGSSKVGLNGTSSTNGSANGNIAHRLGDLS